MQVNFAIKKFLQSIQENYSEKTVYKYDETFWVFAEYLNNWCKIQNIEDISEHQFREFLSWWYIRKHLGSSGSKAVMAITHLKRFLKWLGDEYQIVIDNNGEVKGLFEKLKVDLPRIFAFMDLLNSNYGKRLINNNLQGCYEMYTSGWFEVVMIAEHFISLINIFDGERVNLVRLAPELICLIHCGDIINLELGKNKKYWEIINLGFAYPQMAKPFIH